MTDPSLPASAPPADWYPDPGGQWDFRYWNGHSWTAHVSRAGTAYVDPQTAHLPTGPSGEAAAPAQAEPAQPERVEHEGLVGHLRREHREEKAERTEVEELVRRAADGDDEAVGALPEAVARVEPGWLERHRTALLAEAVRLATGDYLLDVAESTRLRRVAEALHTSLEDLRQHQPDAFDALVIGQVNDGRLPVVTDPPILTRRGEKVHGVFRADLMTEVTRHELQGSSSGVSIPLGMGMRYRAGAGRGHSEVVGSELVGQDSGILAVTSARSVFSGQRKTLEFRHDRLVDLQEYADGLLFNVSARQTASFFRFHPGSSPSLAAALVMGARQRGRPPKA